MKLGRVGRSLIGLAVFFILVGLIWPGAANSILPGSGSGFAAIRSTFGLDAILPAYVRPGAATQTADAPQGQQGQRGAQSGQNQNAGGRGGPGGAQSRPPVPVILDTASRGALPVIVEAVGSAQAFATVQLRSRVDAHVDEIKVADGAVVKEGDVVALLDSRQVEAQIKQAEASLARNTASLEQARRDVARFEELLERSSGTKVNLDNARTQVASAQALIMGDRAQIENLKVQLSFYTIRAPISGRAGLINVKPGNIIRSGDATATGAIATIVQTKPIYVAFSVPQRLLAELREAEKAGGASVEARPQGATRVAKGVVAFIDNTIDTATGTITVRARFDNDDELLWPGQLCNLRIALRVEPDAVSIPRSATQAGQAGNFVYVVENGVARMRPVTIARTFEGRDVVSEGLKGGESIVVEGGLALFNGARIEARPANAKRDS
jgi:multidrug efflux system membrane fusion protein